MKRNRDKRLYKWDGRKTFLIGLLVLLVTLFVAFNRDLFSLILAGEIETIQSKLTGGSPYAYLFMLCIMIIQNSFTVVPLILVITANIALFGAINGFVWSWITSVIAGALVFLCVRYIFQERMLKRFNQEMLDKVEQKGFVYVFQGRIFPFIPTSLINLLAGVSSIRFRDFIFATAGGNFLFFIVLSLVPAGILSADLNEYELGLLLFIVVTILFAFKKFYGKKKRKLIEQPANVAAGQQLDE